MNMFSPNVHTTVILILNMVNLLKCQQISDILDSRCVDAWRTQIHNLQEKINVANSEWQNALKSVGSPTFCMNDVNIHPDLVDFKYVFEHMRNHRTENVFPTVMMDYGKVSRINVPDTSSYNLRQWMAVHVDVFKSPLQVKGIIVLANKAPLGVPFGEFRNDFQCQQDRVMKRSYIRQAVTVPCSYRPKSSIRHPNIFVIKKQNETLQEFVFTFNWIDVLCNEVASIQFQLLEVADFGSENADPKYRISLMGVLVPEKGSESAKDSDDGVPNEYYEGFKYNTQCSGDPNEDVCEWNPSPEKKCKLLGNSWNSVKSEKLVFRKWELGRIYQNIDYINCVSANPPDTLECPPGPFACAKDNQIDTVQEFKTLFQGYDTEGKSRLGDNSATKCLNSSVNPNFNILDCKVVRLLEAKCFQELKKPKSQNSHHPNPSVLGRKGRHTVTGSADMGNSSLTLQQAFELNAKNIHNSNRRMHAVFMVGGLFFLYPIANFLARFFKETTGSDGTGCCAMAHWCLVHIVLHFAILIMVFTAWGIASEPACAEEYSRDIMGTVCHNHEMTISGIVHQILGYIVLILLFINVALGWVRPLDSAKSAILKMIHRIIGYCVEFIAVVCVALSVACHEVIVLLLSFPVVHLVMLAIGVVVHMKTKKCGWPKLLLLGAHIILNLLLYGTVIFVYRRHKELLQCLWQNRNVESDI